MAHRGARHTDPMRHLQSLILSGALALAACDGHAPQPAPDARASHAAAGQGGAPPPPPADTVSIAIDTEPQLAGCRLDTCSWTKTTAGSVVRSDARGTLVRLTMQTGTSQTSTAETLRGAVHWAAHPRTIHVFCSRLMPALITDGHVAALDFVHGIEESDAASANLLSRTCLGGDTWTAPDFAARHGLPGFSGPIRATIDRPEAVFDLAERIAAHKGRG